MARLKARLLKHRREGVPGDSELEDVQVVAMLVRRCVAGDAAAWEEIVQKGQLLRKKQRTGNPLVGPPDPFGLCFDLSSI